jgi:hypothetical protein
MIATRASKPSEWLRRETLEQFGLGFWASLAGVSAARQKRPFLRHPSELEDGRERPTLPMTGRRFDGLA